MAKEKPKSGLDLKSDDGAPPWLMVMRAISGTEEVSGEGDNPKIVGMARYIGRKFPEQKNYSDQYQHDSTAWCGLTAAFCMAAATPDGIKGPFGPTDTDKWMWALSWADDRGYAVLDQPVLGCVVVMEREGGGHVTFFEGTNSDGSYRCRGGNQSDAINVQSYSRGGVVALVWPTASDIPVPQRELSEGDSGADVQVLQAQLGLPPEECDGDFGPTTKAAVKGFQRACGLDPDGVVGPQTYGALDELVQRMDEGGERLPEALVPPIVEEVEVNDISDYPWPGRGTTPLGYARGLALAYAVAVRGYQAGEDWAMDMAAGDTGDPDSDVLSWYKDELKELGWDVRHGGLDTLRALWAILWALGPQESSGNHFCGRDQSASNTDSMTCEAGAWQGSWNLSSCNDQLPILLAEYWDNPSSFLDLWNDPDVDTNAGNIECYGSGDGARAQWLSKHSPEFAAMITAVGLRCRRNHWGPINRRELDLDGMELAGELLHKVERIARSV